MYSRTGRGPLARRGNARPPQNQRLPAGYRFWWEEEAETASRDPLARDGRLAMLEAALLAADEPLNARRLAALIGLKDGVETRRLVRKLQGLYDQEGTAFQVEELAGGFQLLTRPEYHPWLARLRRT